MVTQPVSRSAATSPLPATSSSVTKPWVRLPTEQLPWSAFTVENVDSVAWFQNTQPAGTRPVRPSSSGAGRGRSNGATPAGAASEKVIAMGVVARFSAADRRSDRSFQAVGIDFFFGSGASSPALYHGGGPAMRVTPYGSADLDAYSLRRPAEHRVP